MRNDAQGIRIGKEV